MAVGADDVRVDEGGALPAPAVLDGVAQRVVGLEEVAAVDLGQEQVREAAHQLRDRSAGGVDLDRHGDRVAVVLDEEEDGQLQVAGGIEGFPELAFRGLAFAGRHENDLVLLEPALARQLRNQSLAPPGLGRSDGMQKLGARAGGFRDQVPLLVAPVGGHLAARGGGVILRPDGLQEHLEGGHAELEDQGPIPVVGKEPVAAGPGHHARRRRHRLVAGARDLEVDLVLPLELDFLVVDPAGEVDVAVRGHQIPRFQAMVLGGLDLGGHGTANIPKGSGGPKRAPRGGGRWSRAPAP